MHSYPHSRLARFLAASLLFLATPLLRAQAPAATGSAGGQSWSTETLTNGLRVIYAPMPNVPTAQVRVIYHVGSRDEQSSRQGFAHMFEHMMFRGSAHVAPQEHMKLVSLVGGYCNAFTSFDETVYHDTLPATYTELALWLEADRMSSFKVSPAIFYTERNVVGEEWRMRLNQPYGGMFDLLMPEVFKVHPYQWTPIGNMADLQAARTAELQRFFERYYVPNNAILTIAGNIDVDKTRDQVHKYFDWIPGGTNGEIRAYPANGGPHLNIFGPIVRNIPQEPAQTEPRLLEVKMPAPLARVVLAWHAPRADSNDMDALGLLLSVLGDGQSSRLYRRLVTTDSPLAVSADSFMENLEDGGVMGVLATVLNGKSPDDVEKIIKEEIAQVREKPVTAEELEKVKQQERMSLAQRFETPEKVATELGENMLTYNNLDRVTTARARLEAITTADLQRVAQKYFPDNAVNVMIITPGTFQGPLPGAPSTTAPATEPASTNVNPRAVNFPADYPIKPPMSGTLPAATFEKGTETTLNLPASGDGAGARPGPVHVIVMEDHRMPIINWSLTLRYGGYEETPGKEGLASLTAGMVRRGPKGKTFDQFNDELESRAISLDIGDGGDNTQIVGSCLKEQFPFAMNATREMLLTPAFDTGEFQRLKDQSLSELHLMLDNPQDIASRELTRALYGDSPLGRLTTIKSLTDLSLDDVKQFYDRVYHATGDAILLISGDISVADGQAAAKNLLAGFNGGVIPQPQYTLPKPAESRRILLIDHPSSRQTSIRMGIPAYSITSNEKFAGSLANQLLSGGGIDSRLGRYVRAEKGYVYGITGVFQPSREAGAFVVQTDTRFPTTADTIEATFKVLDELKTGAIPDKELSESKSRVAGGLLMSMQRLSDQAAQRLTGILNGYPIDYYDKYAQRISQVTAGEITDVANKYIHDDRMTIIVVGPADTLKPQLEKIGPVEVIPASSLAQ